jgi:D-glycero-D-manno-heptose 1,7-bisphosphate phosphatase
MELPYKAVFFDLDDTLIRGYMPSELQAARPYHEVTPLPGRKEALHQLLDAGIKIGIASNQGGVAFGFVTEQQAYEKRRNVLKAFDLWDPAITGMGVLILMSFYHPNATVGPSANPALARWRKPEPGMLLTLADQYGIHPSQCLYVGDRLEDQLAAERAGMDFSPADLFFPFDQFQKRWVESINQEPDPETRGNSFEALIGEQTTRQDLDPRGKALEGTPEEMIVQTPSLLVFDDDPKTMNRAEFDRIEQVLSTRNDEAAHDQYISYDSAMPDPDDDTHGLEPPDDEIPDRVYLNPDEGSAYFADLTPEQAADIDRIEEKYKDPAGHMYPPSLYPSKGMLDVFMSPEDDQPTRRTSIPLSDVPPCYICHIDSYRSCEKCNRPICPTHIHLRINAKRLDSYWYCSGCMGHKG